MNGCLLSEWQINNIKRPGSTRWVPASARHPVYQSVSYGDCQSTDGAAVAQTERHDAVRPAGRQGAGCRWSARASLVVPSLATQTCQRAIPVPFAHTVWISAAVTLQFAGAFQLLLQSFQGQGAGPV